MALDTVSGNGSFYLKPGGAMEEALPTELGADQFTQSSGITSAGRLIRMPGKRLVTEYNDRVLQIAGFGGAVIIQHGNTLIMYPDACAISPTDDDDANRIIVTAIPHEPLTKTSSHSYSPVPWTLHPNIQRLDGTIRVNYPPPFYGDIGIGTVNVNSQDGTFYYKEIELTGYANAGGANGGGEWVFGAELVTRQAEGYLDLRNYKSTEYVSAALTGTSIFRRSISQDPSTWNGEYQEVHGGYKHDVTSHLGAKDYISLPYPQSTPWQYFFLRDSQNTAYFYLHVKVLALELVKRKKTNS